MVSNTVLSLQDGDSDVSFHRTLFDKLFGAVIVGSFIVIWISSIASPFLFLLSVWYGYRVTALVIIAITVAAYAPIDYTNTIVAIFLKKTINSRHPKYYRRVQIVFEDGLPDAKNTRQQQFFAIHPHGAFCVGWSILFVHPAMQHVRFCFAPVLYLSPFFRIFSRCTGNPGSASRMSMQSYLKSGENVALPPGGFEEATLTSTLHDRVFIKKRTGFIRLSLQHGAAVRPVYVFGERHLFGNVQGWWRTRLSLNRFGLPTILVWGQWFFPILPRNQTDLYIVVGKPLGLPKIDNPTKEDVTRWHKQYMVELVRLFDRHVDDAYGRDGAKASKLELW